MVRGQQTRILLLTVFSASRNLKGKVWIFAWKLNPVYPVEAVGPDQLKFGYRIEIVAVIRIVR